ncbi:MAG: T9SS type A sorting domain-containing protein [Bacteroidota bacterium]
MRKVYKQIFILFFIFTTLFKLNAQVSLYAFSQFTAPYTNITAGTVYGNTLTDDQVFLNVSVPLGQGMGSNGAGLPIGFTFTMNGLIFDRLSIDANGFICLGTSSISPFCETYLNNQYTPISATSSVMPVFQHKVVGFGMDIQGQATGSGSEIRMQTIGASPNRTAVVQWTNYRKYNNTGDDFNFQIRLIETANIIEVRYGNFINNATAGSAQIGLRGALNNDFNNRFTNALNSWANSSPGSLVNTAANFNVNLVPSSGLVYRWTPPPMCTGTPTVNNIVGSPTVMCPGGSSTLMLSGSYTNSGISYQWQASSTSSTGPFSAASVGGVPIYYANNVSSSVWYQCVVGCMGSGQSSVTQPILIQTSSSLVNNLPYLEDFEGIIVNNQLPNCSWAASNPSVICQTYTSSNTNNRVPHTGYGFASFRYGTQTNGDFFYSNGIQLYAGVTYSASVWYVNDATPGWNLFSMSVGPNQSTLGLTAIASVTGNIANISYQSLSNTFTVASNGVYYIAIRAYGTNSTYYLSFDDLSITAPCSLNSPSMSISATNSVICSGLTTTLNVSGANTYAWSNGSNAASISISPATTNTFTAVGTLTNSGCSQTVSQIIQVNPSPAISIFASPLSICVGSTSTLFGLGADTYTWSSGSSSYSTVVSPSVTSTYSVIGTNTYGCQNGANIQIAVLPSPTVAAVMYPTQICANETATLAGFGAASYYWQGSNYIYSTATNFVVKPSGTINFTLTGTGTNGCSSSTFISLLVNACTAIDKAAITSEKYSIAPNPFNERISIRTISGDVYHIKLYDLTGKLCFEKNNLEGNFDIRVDLNAGVYFLELESENYARIIKIMKTE